MKQKGGGGGGGGGGRGAGGFFWGTMGPQVATSWEEKNVKPPYLDSRFQNYEGPNSPKKQDYKKKMTVDVAYGWMPWKDWLASNVW